MPVCVPIKELKETAKFAHIVEENDDVIVTKNGSEAFHCLSNEKYDYFQEEFLKAKLSKRLDLAMQETKASDYIDFDDFIMELK